MRNTGEEDRYGMKTFLEWLDEGLFLEGHHYLRKTGLSIERELNRLSLRCSVTSGTPEFRYWDSKRKDLIRTVEKMRPLRRSEYIDLYGYNSWLKYVADHELPESHKWADAEYSEDRTPVRLGEGLDASDLGKRSKIFSDRELSDEELSSEIVRLRRSAASFGGGLKLAAYRAEAERRGLKVPGEVN